MTASQRYHSLKWIVFFKLVYCYTCNHLNDNHTCQIFAEIFNMAHVNEMWAG